MHLRKNLAVFCPLKPWKAPKIGALREVHLFCSPILVDANGLEPPTSCVWSRRSNQLSYASMPWSWWGDLNPWPADYESAALPTEPHQQLYHFGTEISNRKELYHIKAAMSSLFLNFLLYPIYTRRMRKSKNNSSVIIVFFNGGVCYNRKYTER